MSAQRLKLLAIVLIVLGAALIVWGLNLSDSVTNEILRVFNGSSMDEVVYRYIAGAVSLAAGLFLFLKEK
jgi:tRNA(Ile)-lysidine synthase TilS/MesJ